MNDIVYALALDDAGNLYAGGHFTMAREISANGGRQMGRYGLVAPG